MIFYKNYVSNKIWFVPTAAEYTGFCQGRTVKIIAKETFQLVPQTGD
jgi:hypothetical protein